MSESPSVGETVIDNIISRKHIRADAIRRGKSRDRVNISDARINLWNTASTLNAKAPLVKVLTKRKLDRDDFPDHISLIPDGNRRWASSRNLDVSAGYAEGSEKLEKFRKWAMVDNDVSYASCFTLSTENIERRPDRELSQLFAVFTKFFDRVADTEEVHEHEIKHEVRGNKEAMDKLPEQVINSIERMENATESYSNHHIVFLMPYGGRDEIISAARVSDSPLAKTEGKAEGSKSFRENLLLGDFPDVDLMLRTSEIRLSNFMLYHNAYSEFVFLKKNWPNFTESDFYESIYKYSNRDRRFGV